MRPMLAGLTLPLEYQSALQSWQSESRERKLALKSDDTQPLARGFFAYASDPNADGDDSDSLLLEDWWGNAEPGRNQQMMDMYGLSQRENIYLADGLVDKAVAAVKYGLEVIAPSSYVKTTMADYIPNPVNIFMDVDGKRIDPIGETSFLKRTGIVLGQGLVGYAIMGAGVLAVLSVTPKITERTFEIVEQAAVGTLEIAEQVVTKGWKLVTLKGIRTGSTMRSR